MSRNKSVFRQPGAQHFQVLHRSLRDPLTNDESASSHVLASVPRRGQKSNAAVQEEVEHGITYEDDYDYLQHLRTIGTEREAVFVAADRTQQKKTHSSSKTHTEDGIALPAEALPSKEERDYAEMLGIPDRPFGLQPAMDPKLREVLEALEDDAYVGAKQEDDEDFFETLMGSGEGDELEEDEWEEEEKEDTRTGWEKHMDQFKAAAPPATTSDSEEEFDSEAGDTIADLRESSARRPARGTGASTAKDSAFSMSSSAMFRNEGLRTLDDRFDQLEREYESNSDEYSDEDDYDDEPVDLGEKRPDLSGILDDFLSRYKTLGAQPADADSDARYAQLDELRKEMRAVTLHDGADTNKDYILKRAAELDAIEEQGKHERTQKVALDPGPGDKDRWDCQTILTTRSNLENHPKMIRLRDISGKSKKQLEPPRRILLDPKTGFPSLADPLQPTCADSDEASTSDLEQGPPPQVLARDRNESKEDKKARKAAVKAERANRRVEKKGNKDAFEAEMARQKGLHARSNKADKQVGQKGVVSLS